MTSKDGVPVVNKSEIGCSDSDRLVQRVQPLYRMLSRYLDLEFVLSYVHISSSR